MLDAAVTDDQVIASLNVIKLDKELFPENAAYLWRLAKATFIYANQCVKKNPAARTVLLKEAKDYADRARKLAPTDADVLKWSALTTGGLARYADTTQKINFGLLTREFLQSALGELQRLLNEFTLPVNRSQILRTIKFFSRDKMTCNQSINQGKKYEDSFFSNGSINGWKFHDWLIFSKCNEIIPNQSINQSM